MLHSDGGNVADWFMASLLRGLAVREVQPHSGHGGQGRAAPARRGSSRPRRTARARRVPWRSGPRPARQRWTGIEAVEQLPQHGDILGECDLGRAGDRVGPSRQPEPTLRVSQLQLLADPGAGLLERSAPARQYLCFGSRPERSRPQNPHRRSPWGQGRRSGRCPARR